jgi:autophagy-related protein 16
LKLIDFRNYKVIRTFQHPNFTTSNNYTRCCFSPDGKYVVSGGAEGAIYIWNIDTSDIEAVLKSQDVHTTHVNCVAWNPNMSTNSQIASADKSGIVSLWQ